MQPTARRYLLAVLALVAANFFGGLSYYWIKLSAPVLGPMTVAALRNLFALPLLRLMCAWRGSGRRCRFTGGERARLGAVAIGCFALPQVLGTVGTEWSSATMGSILILLEPMALLVFARILLSDRLVGGQVLGVVLGLAGALCLVVSAPGASLGDVAQQPAAGGGGANGDRAIWGNTLLLLHAVLWGLYTPLLQPLARSGRHSVEYLTLMMLVISSVPLVCLACWERTPWVWSDSMVTAIGGVLLLAWVVTGAATLLWNWSLRWLPAASTAPFIFIQPLVGGLVGYFWLGERYHDIWFLGGAGLIVAGGLAVTLAKLRN